MLNQEYLLLFNVITDVAICLRKLEASLIFAQQRAEELYVNRVEVPIEPACDAANCPRYLQSSKNTERFV